MLIIRLLKGFNSIVLFAAFTLFLAEGLKEASAEDVHSEYEVKIAFIYNFTKFVEWPDSAFAGPNDPVRVVVLGHNPFGDAFALLKDKKVKGRKIIVKHVSDIHNIGDCQILFISQSEKWHLEEIISAIDDMPVLLIGEMDQFILHGGMIKFVAVGNKIGFEINNSAARRVRLKISSQLLKLARAVID